MKPMRFDFKNSNPFSFPSLAHKRNHLFVKFAVFSLLLGLAFRLFVSYPIQFPSETTDPASPVAQNATFPPPADTSPVSSDLPVDESSPANESLTSQNVTAECDIFMGEWVPDSSGPYYSSESCQHIEAHQNCMKNGRPDSDYVHWRWKPRDCELPKFDPRRFLGLMRNKSFAFIGDSISRNHVQSLLCTLSQVEFSLQVEEAVEVYHDKEYKSKRWHFPSHNFTLSVIWTPFLIKAAIFEDINGVSSADIQLHLDKLDTLWTEQYINFDYVIIAGGKWFLKTAIYYENNMIKGCHYCPGKNLTELGFDHAYRKALELIFKFVTNSNHKAHVLFRTTTPDHFENGEWFSGGYCNRTGPFKEGEADLNFVDTTLRNIELEEFEKAVEIGSGKGVTLKLVDTTHLSLLRPDGHPGVYRAFQPFAKGKNEKLQNDCLHWCLPGPIESWNELFSSETTHPSLVEQNVTFPPPPNTSLVSGHLLVDESFPASDNITSQNDQLTIIHTVLNNLVTTECDIFTGQWVPDSSGPFYTSESCKHIEAPQNCLKNGRPDSDYVHWRWKPRDCELPKFDPRKFLDLMRNKSFAFIGDSIQRNHQQSLLCTLSQVEEAVEVYHVEEYRSRRWHFSSHNFTLSVFLSPFLLKAAILEDTGEIHLHLDKLDTQWSEQYTNFDYVVIAGGKWFPRTATYYENNTIKGCHYCPSKNLTELGFDHAYHKALQLIFNFVTSSNHKAHVLFRTTAADHFENGEWYSGGYCNRTGPFKEGEADLTTEDKTLRDVELEEFEKAVEIGSRKGVTLKLLDINHLSLLRPDGHPGVYLPSQPFSKGKHEKLKNDCLHWCLPGPIDSWNELLMQMLFSG
ncbi:hypothetical protein C3L33_07888, partial [Rhododendron williamsianum]